MKTYIVYMHTTPSNKKYIGITSMPTSRRWRFGSNYQANQYFTRAIKKYGWENIRHEILLSGLTEDEAKQKEIELIAEHDTTNSGKGYNHSSGGGGSRGMKYTDEQRKAVSESLKEQYRSGKRKPMTGRKWTDEQRAKLAEARATNPPRHSDESKAKISKAKKGKPLSESNYIALVESRKKLYKPVVQMNRDGAELRMFESMAEAAKLLGVPRATTHIGKCCKGTMKTAYGYKWKYA